MLRLITDVALRAFLLTALVAVFLCPGGPGGAGGAMAWESLREMNAQIDRTNFAINNGVCSATLVVSDDGDLLTAAHCVSEHVTAKTVTDLRPDGSTVDRKINVYGVLDATQSIVRDFETITTSAHQVLIVRYAPAIDLALLAFIGPVPYGVPARILAPPRTIERGEMVFAVGNPHGLEASVSAGVVAHTSRVLNSAVRDNFQAVQITAPIHPGSSGDAVYNTDGEIIGIAVSRMTLFPTPFIEIPVATISWAVPASVIREFLRTSPTS